MEVVENAASTDRMPADGIYVRERVTYPDSGLSGGSSSTRRSRTASERSTVTAPSSASSLSSSEPKAGSARLSPVIEVLPPLPQSRRPHAPPPPPPPPGPIMEDGTAQYSRPPMGIEPALEVEHPFRLLENTSEGETSVYAIRDTGTNPARVSRRPRAPFRYEIKTPNSARILSTDETTEHNWSARQPGHATERPAISPRRSSMTRNAQFQDEQHLISVFVQDLRVALHARFGRVPETRKVSRSIAVLLKSYSVILKQFQTPGNHLERCAVKFVRDRREQVYAVTEVLNIC